MSEKRFTLSNFASPSQLSDVCDDGGKMLNKEVVDLLNEQQDTIFKLQNLCGQSDGENTKLRIENKRLQEENEQLRKELDNFKPVMFQDVRKGTVILYSKG